MNINQNINKLLYALKQKGQIYKINSFKFYSEKKDKYATKYQVLKKELVEVYNEDKDKTELHYNSEWFGQMNFKDVINLCSKTTVARMLERDDFNNRMNNHKPIAIHEFFYPLMQAYDSVVVKSDLELGGTDQTFNVMMGRNIQKDFGVSQQVPVFVPLLVGIDGKEKMSKSLGNYIGVDEDAKVMYAKVMKIPDDLIITYYQLTTDVHPDRIRAVQKLLENGEINPRDIKMHLARSIVSLYHTPEEVKEAENNFQAIFQKKDIEIELPELVYDSSLIDENGDYSLIDCIFASGKYKSKSEVRRLIQQGAVRINGEKTNELTLKPVEGTIIQVGKGNVFKLTSLQKKQEKGLSLTRGLKKN